MLLIIFMEKKYTVVWSNLFPPLDWQYLKAGTIYPSYKSKLQQLLWLLTDTW